MLTNCIIPETDTKRAELTYANLGEVLGIVRYTFKMDSLVGNVKYY